MSDELMQVYQQRVLEHSRNPHHFGALTAASHTAEGFNPLCGDKVTVYLQADGDTIETASHETSGCAICMSSASMMSDAIQSISTEAARSLCAQMDAMLRTEHAGTAPGMPLQSLQGVRAYPSRVKCATLPWQTLLAALGGENNTTTEGIN